MLTPEQKEEVKKYNIPKRFVPCKEHTVLQFDEINKLGAECYYVENFFTKAESDAYLALLMKEFPFHQEKVSVFGKEFDQPRLSRLMGDVGKNYEYSGHVREAVEWIPGALEIRNKIMKFVKTIRPEHPTFSTVLGNLYMDGTRYIGDHSDDETDLVGDAFICSISLGSERDFDVKDKKTKEMVLRLLLAHGSLLVMGKNFQKLLKHGVPKRLKVKDPRINLTFRCLLA